MLIIQLVLNMKNSLIKIGMACMPALKPGQTADPDNPLTHLTK